MSRLLHITDSHLFSHKSACLKGVCTYDSFAAVIKHAQARFPKPEAIILGGDMAQDECAASYQLLADMLQGWHVPWMLSPGNHANLTALQGTLIPALQSLSSFSSCLQLEFWQLITLNSHAEGSVGGVLDEAELQRLDALLSAEPDKHTLIAVHHPPVAIHCRWLDRIGLNNRQSLWEVIKGHANVRAILCGHVHQAFDAMHDGVRVLTSPSTCIQFKPKQDMFELDAKSPAYRWIELLPDGNIHTAVERIEGFIPEDLCNGESY